ncbi:MAG: glycosyltransferase family 39 protein [Bacteroidota bacterium]
MLTTKTNYPFYLSTVWLLCIAIINPIGDFPLNDDWSYALNAKTLAVDNEIYFDDWGAMTLFAHTLWGALFCKIFGYSHTVLRLSTLVLGWGGMLASYYFFKEAKINEKLAAGLALLLAFNPIYFNVSFTYMTDVPYLCYSLVAAYFLLKYLHTSNIYNIVFATLFSVLATLIRQPGILIPIAFLIVALLKAHRTLRHFLHAALPSIITIVSLLFFMYWRKTNYGLSSHFGNPSDVLDNLSNGVFTYFIKEKTHGFFMYWGLFLLPVLIYIFPKLINRKNLRLKLLALVLTLVSSYPFWEKWHYDFHGNIFYNFGLGPKTLGLPPLFGFSPDKLDTLPAVAWDKVKLIAFISGVILLFFIWKKGLQLATDLFKKKFNNLDWAALFGLAIAIGYFLFLLTNNFLFDRYYLTVLPFLILIIFPKTPIILGSQSISRWSQSLAFFVFLALALFALAGTKDYLEWNKSRWEAIRYALVEKQIPVDQLNGGFEFRYWKDKKVPTNFDWENTGWWLDNQERYYLEFTELCGYETIKTFSNRRFVPPGRDTIFLLKKIRHQVLDTIRCDAETITPDSNFLKSNQENIRFENVAYRSDEKSLSGQYSILTHLKHPEGFKLTLRKVQPCDRFWFHVWRYPARSSAAVVARSATYWEGESNKLLGEKDGWGILYKEFVIPENYADSTLTFFLMNNSESPVWFDDVEIVRGRSID